MDRDRGFDLDERVTDRQDDVPRQLSPTDRVAERGYFAAPAGGDLPVLDAAEALVFGSNNYLGLTADQRVQDAARQAAATVGTGAGSSRVVTGDTIVHHDLERLVAETVATERALAFSSGYAATVGTIDALDPDVIFSDELNHEGVVDGCRLSEATVIGYEHCNVPNLRAEMAERADGNGHAGESWLVVTNTVFPADGTVAPLEAICEAAEEFGAWVMVDETHATGLYANGGGIVQAEGLADRVHVQLGALSTALASQGGYVAGSDALIECLVGDARSFACSTGLAPAAAAAASEALHVSRHGNCRDRLWENVAHLRDGLETMGFDVLGDSQILPIVVGDRRDAVALAEGVRDRGVVAPAIRPSTRIEEAGRVRVTPMSTHDRDDVVTCLEAFQAAGEELGLL